MELNKLDFINDSEDQLQRVPKDILRSSSIESLISQNEDLMARLKVTIRRLSLLEAENQRLAEESQKAKLGQNASQDQLLVLKEKDRMWRAKAEQAERERDIIKEKSLHLETAFRRLQSEVERYKKYHERIKNQVKPYVAQIKEYSRSLEQKNQTLESQHARNEALIRDLRHQMGEVTKHARLQVDNQEARLQELTAFYEEQLKTAQKQLSQMGELQAELEVKTTRLNKALEQADTFENEVINLRRHNEEMKARLEADISRLQSRQSELTRQNQKLGMEHSDLQIRVMEDQTKIQKMQQDNDDLQQQIESLRYMWTQKNEETERLKAALQSMERLNIDLSAKINQLRQNQNSNQD